MRTDSWPVRRSGPHSSSPPRLHRPRGGVGPHSPPPAPPSPAPGTIEHTAAAFKSKFSGLAWGLGPAPADGRSPYEAAQPPPPPPATEPATEPLVPDEGFLRLRG